MSSKNSDTKTRILDSAWKLLEAGGEVRMVDIARAVGLSRQALYLHFPTRAELLIATTRHLDAVKDVDSRLKASRAAGAGVERLDAFVEAWGNYIPEIYGVGRALMAMQDSDAEAQAAWSDRMNAVREGCEAAVKALARDGQLVKGLTRVQATDFLWTLLSVENWEQLTSQCGWSQKTYLATIKMMARRTLVSVE